MKIHHIIGITLLFLCFLAKSRAEQQYAPLFIDLSGMRSIEDVMATSKEWRRTTKTTCSIYDKEISIKIPGGAVISQRISMLGLTCGTDGIIYLVESTGTPITEPSMGSLMRRLLREFDRPLADFEDWENKKEYLRDSSEDTFAFRIDKSYPGMDAGVKMDGPPAAPWLVKMVLTFPHHADSKYRNIADLAKATNLPPPIPPGHSLSLDSEDKTLYKRPKIDLWSSPEAKAEFERKQKLAARGQPSPISPPKSQEAVGSKQDNETTEEAAPNASGKWLLYIVVVIVASVAFLAWKRHRNLQ